MATKLLVPQTVAEMQEILNTPTIAAEWIRNGQFSEVVDAYRAATTPQFADQVANLQRAFFESQGIIEEKVANAVQQQITMTLAERGVTTRPVLGEPSHGGPDGPRPGPGGARMNAAYNPLAFGAKADGLFTNMGDIARATWHKQTERSDRMAKLGEVQNAFSTVEPSAGGFLIPESMRSELMQLALETAVVRPRATVITMTNPTQLIPYVDATTNSGSVFGGMVFYWTEEAGSINFSQAKFGRAKLEAWKLAGGARVPNELYADAAALNSFLMQSVPRGLAFFEDLAFLTGGGAGQPLGVLNASALITVAKEAGQPADTIVTENILKMYARMLPSSLGSAVWVVNQTTFPELMTLTLDVGTGGAPVALVDIRSGPLPTMLGRPIVVTEKVPALGDPGDINLIDFGYYLIGDRQAISIESSPHAAFETDETLVKVIERVDGRPWLQSALTPANGDMVSPFVTLAERA